MFGLARFEPMKALLSEPSISHRFETSFGGTKPVEAWEKFDVCWMKFNPWVSDKKSFFGCSRDLVVILLGLFYFSKMRPGIIDRELSFSIFSIIQYHLLKVLCHSWVSFWNINRFVPLVAQKRRARTGILWLTRWKLPLNPHLCHSNFAG